MPTTTTTQLDTRGAIWTAGNTWPTLVRENHERRATGSQPHWWGTVIPANSIRVTFRFASNQPPVITDPKTGAELSPKLRDRFHDGDLAAVAARLGEFMAPAVAATVDGVLDHNYTLWVDDLVSRRMPAGRLGGHTETTPWVQRLQVLQSVVVSDTTLRVVQFTPDLDRLMSEARFGQTILVCADTPYMRGRTPTKQFFHVRQSRIMGVVQ